MINFYGDMSPFQYSVRNTEKHLFRYRADFGQKTH